MKVCLQEIQQSILENIEKLFSLICKIFYVPLHNYVRVRQPEKNVIIAI